MVRSPRPYDPPFSGYAPIYRPRVMHKFSTKIEPKATEYLATAILSDDSNLGTSNTLTTVIYCKSNEFDTGFKTMPLL